MNIIFYPKPERKLIGDMGNALKFMLEFCGGYEKCRECDFKEVCYNLSKLADEFVSIGGKDDRSEH